MGFPCNEREYGAIRKNKRQSYVSYFGLNSEEIRNMA
jgi:hypothetical protein